VRRGAIRSYTFAKPDKRRPVLLFTRDEVIDTLNELIVAPVTRTVRGLETELLLTPDDGMPVVCAVNLDHVGLVQHDRLGPVITHLPEDRWPQARRALLVACGFGGTT
jgi:mRNA interferase MazF